MKSINDIATLLIKQRKILGIEQKDMFMKIGMKQQQYQRIESGSDVKLSTLLRVLEGLDLELSITPKGKKIPYSSVENGPLSQSNADNSKRGLEDDSDDLGFWFESEDNS